VRHAAVSFAPPVCTQEVSELLFEHMKLPVPPNAQRGKGRSAFISTNADVLEVGGRNPAGVGQGGTQREGQGAALVYYTMSST
jgi:hypothetical protein